MIDGTVPITLPAAALARENGEGADCMACGHAFDTHDAIAVRFCNATVERALTRGCICNPPAK
jgi:hypothetical protein